MNHLNDRSHKLIRSFRARADRRRSAVERIADFLTQVFGGMWFLMLNVVWFAVWIAVNLGAFPGIAIFDPFPFGLLTMVVSLEAIILSIVVLVSQNRQSKINDLGQEIDMQVNIITEREITKILELTAEILKRQGGDIAKDAELQEMLQPIDTSRIEQTLTKQLETTTKKGLL